MQTEATVNLAAAMAAMVILAEYLTKGGAINGVRTEDVEEFVAALADADRITIRT